MRRAPAGFVRGAMASPLARASGVLVVMIVLLAAYAPVIASGHPLVMRWKATGLVTSPLVEMLGIADTLIVMVTSVGLAWVAVPTPRSRAAKSALTLAFLVQAIVVGVLCERVSSMAGAREAPPWMRSAPWLPIVCAGGASVLASVLAALLVVRAGSVGTLWMVAFVGLAGTGVGVWKWPRPPETFPYESVYRAGEVSVRYTLVPFSPNERPVDRDGSLLPAWTRAEAEFADGAVRRLRLHVLGTDGFGQDVLSQLVHGCRLAVTVGFVATGVALAVGVFVGALMGALGGVVDAVLLRVVEVFMSLPVLFVLIVAAGIFPRDVMVMSVLLGMFSWPSVARLVRAEFLSMRTSDYVLAARAQGIPGRSILFGHMLPNGVASSIVDASFTVSAAVLAEAVISYLGFGPAERASWGRLLSQAVSETGGLVTHLAIAPGLMIFLTVFGANAIGSALNASLDPSRRVGL